jgi:hypothetical protein
MRVYAAIGAVLGWFALALQLYLMLLKVPAGQMLGTVITFFSFFTILINILVALVLTVAGFRLGWGQWFHLPSVQAGSAVYIAIVGCSYQLLLRHLWNPQGGQWVADILLHSVIPLVYILYWLLFAPRTGLRWKDALTWLICPAVYWVYVLARGALTGIYPYPFVDVTVLGYAGALARAGVFFLVFLGTGLLVVAVGRWIRGRSPA